MKKYLGVVVFVIGFNASADYIRLECTPKEPCKFADDQCIDKIVIAGEIPAVEETVYTRVDGRSSREVIPVSIKKSQNSMTFSDESGDDWGRLTSSGPTVYTGVITYGQDFEYEVRCLNNTSFLEPGITIRN